jgi:hypothetical protein
MAAKKKQKISKAHKGGKKSKKSFRMRSRRLHD